MLILVVFLTRAKLASATALRCSYWKTGELSYHCIKLCIFFCLTALATTCEKACTRDYRPKCGTDGTTYSNQCELEIAMCKDSSLELHSDGPCGKL